MKVILLQDVQDLGQKYEIKDVAKGYIRNFLLPRKLVKLASKENLNWLEKEREKQTEEAEQDLKQVQSIVSEIDGIELNIPVKLNKKGKLYASITQTKISKRLKKKGFNVKKDDIDLKNPIKEIGEYPVKISFTHGLEAEIKIIISAEEEGIDDENEDEDK